VVVVFHRSFGSKMCEHVDVSFEDLENDNDVVIVYQMASLTLIEELKNPGGAVWVLKN
jgi:hypothetical protein